MEFEINGEKVQVKEEMKYLEAVEIEETKGKEGLRAAMKKYLVFVGLTEDQAENLGIRDGLEIQKKLEAFSKSLDFQKPIAEEKEN